MSRSSKTVHHFDSHADSVRNSGAAILGTLAWFAVPDLRVSHADLTNLAKVHGLSNPPKLGSAADAFRRATNSQTRRGENRTTRYLVRPVKNSGEELVRQIVVERVNASEELLTHETLADLRFDEKSEVMTVGTMDSESGTPEEYAEAEKMMTEAKALFREYKNSFTGDAVRRYVSRLLDEMCRVTVHPHGHVYFVPRSSAGDVEATRLFVRSLAPYTVNREETPTFWTVPVPDLTEQREMVQNGFRSTMLSDLAQVSGDLREMLAGTQTWTGRKAASKVELIAELREKAARYKSMLGIHVGEVDSMIDILNGQALELVERAEAEKAAG